MPDDAAFTAPPEIDTLDVDLAIAEERFAVMRELTQLAMTWARDLTRRAVEAPDVPDANAVVPRLDPAEAFCKVSRAIRLTVSLEAKTHEELRALRAGIVIERGERAKKAADRDLKEGANRYHERFEKVRHLVIEAAEREVGDHEEMAPLIEALEQRLVDDDAYIHLDDLPLFETVKHLCEDLELNPDWSLWTGEDWGPKDPFARYRWSSYRRPSRKPIEDP
jgi:hypothetical protein